MYSNEEAITMYREARIVGLSGSELLEDAQAIIRDCNGIGADWMPTAMRKLCTALNPVMTLPAAIHDRRYAIGGAVPGRLFADAEFLANSQIMIDRTYCWLNPLRYLMRHRANLYYSLLRAFGGAAYNEKGREA